MTTQQIRTADGQTVEPGDRVFDYYDGHWGVVGDDVDEEGWFTHHRDNGGRGLLNGERVAVVLPRTNPLYAAWEAGR